LFINLIPNNPAISTILTGHLILEEIVREILYKTASREKSIQDAKLTFNQCVHLLRASYPDKLPIWTWKAIHKVNKIRNSMAHSLKPLRIDELVAELYEYLVIETKEKGDKAFNSVDNELTWSIKVLARQILKLLEDIAPDNQLHHLQIIH